MIGYIVYKIYYANDFFVTDNIYSDAILIYTNVGANVDSTMVLNEPILDWELGKAGSITLLLPPSNAGYEAIECKQGHIFIEKNGELIWHGRAITETYDIDGNREIVCEGALNYMLDTHVKPRNSHLEGTARDVFENLIDAHNRALSASSSLIFGRSNWFVNETNGHIDYYGSDYKLWPIVHNYPSLRFTATGATGWGLFAWSNPSIWQYSVHQGHYVRVSFDLEFTKGSANDSFTYGLHLRNVPELRHNLGDRYVSVEGAPITETGTVHIDEDFYIGPGGLEDQSHPDAYIGMHMYMNANAGAEAIVSGLQVEEYEYDIGNVPSEGFLPSEGKRTIFDTNQIWKEPWAPKEYWSFEDTDYPTVLDAINDKFINQHGGYIYVGYKKEYDALGYHWRSMINYISGQASYDLSEDEIVPKVVFGKNLVSFKKTVNYEDCSTIFIPLGRQLEDDEKVCKLNSITYQTGVSINRDGVLVTEQDSRHVVAKILVNVDSVPSGNNLLLPDEEVYYVSGVGRKEYGIYTIVDSNYTPIDHQTFSPDEPDEYTEYEKYQIDISKASNAYMLIVYFFNEHNDPLDSVFSIYRYNFGDREDRITLENYIGDRTDYLAGTKYFAANVAKGTTIEKVIVFEEAETQEQLLAAIRNYSDVYKPEIVSYEVEAVDLTPIADDSENYSLGTPGSYAEVIYPALNVDEILCVSKCSINLRDPAESKYSLANLPPPNLSDLIAKGIINERTNNFAF